MCISFSNFPPYQSSMDEFRGKYVVFFESKGVQISTDKLFDPETTHLVAQKMWRSEKMLGSIASGKWILHPSYIEAKLYIPSTLNTDYLLWHNCVCSKILNLGLNHGLFHFSGFLGKKKHSKLT